MTALTRSEPDFTAADLRDALNTFLDKHPEAGALPVVTIEEGHLTNIARVDLSTMHDGLVLLQGRHFDRPRDGIQFEVDSLPIASPRPVRTRS
ncbi:hypothetical protein AB0A05_27325 [Streptomyces sp. NPDC046374]|uniref:hypothetical protein n=1 Tax=Streptomyces sp. NPDC046374 TaxID=3154917 RepID=UPI0033C2FCB6